MRIDEFENKIKNHTNTLKDSMKVPNYALELIKESEEEIVNKNSVFKRVGLGLVGIAASFILIMNFMPNLAYASQDIPVLGKIVRVVTFGRFDLKENGVDVSVVTPQIEGLLNEELENKLNAEFKEHSNSVIAAIEKEVKDLEKEFGNDFHLGVDANYTIRTDNDKILAIDTYIVNTVASSSTKHSFYTINKKTRELVELDKLFKDNADYITPISEYITDEMKKANENGTGFFWIGKDNSFDGFDVIKADQNFFINDSGNIVICFDKYEVAPGAYGCPEFEIPNKVVKDILK